MRFQIVSLFCAVASVDAASLFTMNVKDKMSSDFLTGFESGIFLRDNKAQFEEYGCPDQEVDSEELRAFKAGIDPIKSLSAMMGGSDPLIGEIIESIEMFVTSFDKFIGVFDETYAGGDFCAGLTFGMQGTKMLQKVATMLYDQKLAEKAKIARQNGG